MTGKWRWRKFKDSETEARTENICKVKLNVNAIH